MDPVLPLVASVVLARDVVVFGESFTTGGANWVSELDACLALARPGEFRVADATASGGRLPRRSVAEADESAIVVLSIALPGAWPATWTRGSSLRRSIRMATRAGAHVLVFGPWPAARRLVRPHGRDRRRTLA